MEFRLFFTGIHYAPDEKYPRKQRKRSRVKEGGGRGGGRGGEGGSRVKGETMNFLFYFRQNDE